MSLLENGDFSNGLDSWRVSEPVGGSAPTFDPDNEYVVFGNATNDVNNGDTLEQDVSLTQGEEYTLTFTMSEVGDSPFSGFGLTIDDAVFRIRGQFGFGTAESDLVLDNFALTCFAEGTMIETPDGPRPIESLQVGDLVITADHGACPINWVGSRHVTAKELARKPEWQPVLIPAGAIDGAAPTSDLVVSPAHRVLMAGSAMELMLGFPEALAPANTLIGALDGVKKVTDLEPVTYYHLLFDQHEVIISNGLPTESFHPAFETVSRFEKEAKSEVLSLFPELADMRCLPFGGNPLQLPKPVTKVRGRWPSGKHGASGYQSTSCRVDGLLICMCHMIFQRNPSDAPTC